MFPRIIDLAQRSTYLLFVDEAVFSFKQVRNKWWAVKGDSGGLVPVQKLGFAAVAVVAATSMDGQVLAVTTSRLSVGKDTFIEFLGRLAAEVRKRRVHIVLDNLRMHLSKEVVEAAHAHGFELVYNAPYTSHLNPIEILWAWSKRKFSTEFMHLADSPSQQQVEQRVRECVASAPRSLLVKHTAKCLREMETELHLLNGGTGQD